MTEHKLNPIRPSRCSLEEHVIQRHVVTLEQHHTYEDLFRPDFWASYAMHLKPFDEITVLYHYDEIWRTELIVMDCGRNHAKVTEKNHTYQILDQGLTARGLNIEGFLVKYGNRHTGHRIIRENDNEVVKEGFPNSDAAFKWLRENVHNLTKAA